MLSKNNKYKFYQKDELYTFFHRRTKIKKTKEYLTTFHIKTTKLRNRSTKNKTKENHEFPLLIFCLTKCKKNCLFENYKNRKNPTPIEGLNCDKIDDHIFASQRLTNELIKQFDLCNKLKEINVGLIVNLQVKGEHPNCGAVYNQGLDINGFSYSPIELEKNGILVFYCGWIDFTPKTFNHMINIVKKMYYYIHILNKKVIVHCHAGMGRTGIVLACYKIFEKKISAEIARKEISIGERKSCLKLGKQFVYCEEFEKYLELSRENFYDKNKKDITIFKINEKMLDVGNYKFKYFNDKNFIENIPVFLLYIFDKIVEIKKEKNYDEKIINTLLTNKELDKEEELIMENLIININKNNWKEIDKIVNLKILGNILFKWLNNSINYILAPKEIYLIDMNNYPLFYNKFNNSIKSIIDCISRFIKLIKDNSKEKSDNIKNFRNMFISSLLGYSISEIVNKKNIETINKLNNIIDYVINNK